MKLRNGMIALAIAGTFLAGTAQALPGGRCGGAESVERMAKGAGARLEKLHGDLKLTPEQEPAWKAWSSGLQARFADAPQRRPDPEAMAKLPAPERMAQMLERMKEREKDMASELASLQTFYGALTPEQKQVFDKFRPFGERREGGKRKE